MLSSTVHLARFNDNYPHFHYLELQTQDLNYSIGIHEKSTIPIPNQPSQQRVMTELNLCCGEIAPILSNVWHLHSSSSRDDNSMLRDDRKTK